MAEGVAIRCPNCSGVVAYNVAAGQVVCEHCGHAFELGDLNVGLPLAEGGRADMDATKADVPEHAETVSQFMERAPWKKLSDADADVRAYTCPTCAAKLLTHGSIVTTSCPYCGNNLLVPAAETEDLVPQYVLPFSVSKSRAKEMLQEHMATVDKAYLPEDFAPDLEHVQGVYVPYYLFDIHVEGEVGAACTRTEGRGKYSTTYHFAISAGGVGQFKQVPMDASSRMPDAHMDAVAPFDLARLAPFSPELLTGFLAELPDEDEEGLRRRAENLAWGSMLAQGPDAIAAKYPKLTRIDPAVGRWSKVQTERAVLCSLPVWLLHCRWRDKDLLFAVNGQTGECVGNMPVDEQRRSWALKKGFMLPFVIAPMLLIACLGLILSSGHGRGVLMFVWMIGLILGFPYYRRAVESARHKDKARIQQIKSARKAETSMENQARQSVSMREFRIRLAPGKPEANEAVSTCYGQPDPRYAQMVSFARNVCNTYERTAEEYGRPIDVYRGDSVLPSAIPLDDEVVAACVKHRRSACPSGYAITSRGLYCSIKSDFSKTGWGYMSWLEFARNRDLTIDRSTIVCGGKVLAYGVQRAQRNRLLYLYQQLWIEARRIFGAAAVEQMEKRKKRARQRQAQMIAGTWRACTDLLRRVGSGCFAQSDDARDVLSIPSGVVVRVIHTNEAQGHPESGFAVSDVGIFCREANETKARFVDWRCLASMPEPRLDGVCVRAGDDSLACYEGDEAVREELLALCRELWLLAK